MCKQVEILDRHLTVDGVNFMGILHERDMVDIDISVPVYDPELSLTESQGGRARAIWARKFGEYKKLASESSEIIFTGIGGAVASDNGSEVSIHGDGSKIPSYVDLKEEYGKVPKVLFLVASPKEVDDINGLDGVAEEYKNQGVEKIIVMMTSLAHERQDHKFRGEDGEIIKQPITLRPVIRTMANSEFIDGGLLFGGHSMQAIEIAEEMDWPLLPMDTFDFMVEESGVRQIDNPMVFGLDKGRKNEALRLAAKLGCPFVVADKSRARVGDENGDGEPTMWIHMKALVYALQNNCTAVSLDDEIREAGTTSVQRKYLAPWVDRLVIVALKGFFAKSQIDTAAEKTAAERLAEEVPKMGGFEKEELIISDAVEPLTVLGPVENKLTIVKMREQLDKTFKYLKENLVPNDANGNEDWLREQKDGLLVRLDIAKEVY